MGRKRKLSGSKWYYEFTYEEETEVFDQKLIENVARQMCIVAGLEPDEYIQATAEETYTPYERYMPTYVGPTEVFGPLTSMPSYGQGMSQFTLERRTLPRVKEAQSVQSFHRWLLFRPAAFMALCGYYAVKQVLMAGEPVRPDPHPELDDDDAEDAVDKLGWMA